MSRRSFIIQKPRDGADFDIESLEKFGPVGFLLPAAPNIHDLDRMQDDIKRMSSVIAGASRDDVFTSIGGSPISQFLFAAAMIRAGRSEFTFGLYSRGRDDDGRRGASSGSYRERTVPLIV